MRGAAGTFEQASSSTCSTARGLTAGPGGAHPTMHEVHPLVGPLPPGGAKRWPYVSALWAQCCRAEHGSDAARMVL